MSSSSGRSAMASTPVVVRGAPLHRLTGHRARARARPRRVHAPETWRRQGLSYSPVILDDVDPFIGTAATDLPPARGLAATWWWPKPQVGNTHPGATSPFGMVSACASSGPYPTGYGRYAKNTEGVPEVMFDRLQASGFTHFHQSGTGAIRKYYNYVRVTPMVQP